MSKVNFIGKVEKYIFDGKVDLVVCDGPTGNVVLKTAEGIAAAITTILKGIHQRWYRKIGAFIMKGPLPICATMPTGLVVGGNLLLGPMESSLSVTDTVPARPW